METVCVAAITVTAMFTEIASLTLVNMANVLQNHYNCHLWRHNIYGAEVFKSSERETKFSSVVVTSVSILAAARLKMLLNQEPLD